MRGSCCPGGGTALDSPKRLTLDPSPHGEVIEEDGRAECWGLSWNPTTQAMPFQMGSSFLIWEVAEPGGRAQAVTTGDSRLGHHGSGTQQDRLHLLKCGGMMVGPTPPGVVRMKPDNY